MTLYHRDVETNTEKNDKGVTETTYTYTEYRFAPGEYEALCNGILPTGAEWDGNLHELYRRTLHRMTDDLYNEAYRNKRISENADAWGEFITALDEWNAKVTALGATFSTDVPDLPEKPTA